MEDKAEEINKAAERLERATAEAREAGVAEAGQEKEKPKEETPKEYADKVMSGETPEA